MPGTHVPHPTRRPRVPALRGRDAELEVIGELLSQATGGHGGVLLVDGPAGTGKTRLLAEATAMAGRNGFRVITGRPSSALASMAFEPLLDALFAGQRPLLGAEVLQGLPTRPEQRYWLAQRLQALIEGCARRQPLLIVLDDLHWAGPKTLASLRAVAAGLAGVPVVWALGAVTEQVSGEARAAIDGVIADGGHRLRLDRLSADAVAQVVCDLLGDAPPPILAELGARADGNPLLLVELVQGLVEEDLLDGDGLPSRVLALARRRLDAFATETSHMLLVGAVLGRFSVEHLADMLDVAPATLLAPIDEALRADLLAVHDDGLAFRHDLLREAAVATLPSSMYHSLRRQAAEVLMVAGAEPEAIASHLAASAGVGDRAAVATLREAAQALGGRDADRAADLSRQAVQLMNDDDPCLTALVAETVVLLDAADRAEEADTVARTILDTAPSAEDEAQIRAALALVGPRPARRRCAENRRALRLGGLAPATVARHSAMLSMNLALAGEHAEAQRLLETVKAAPALCGDAVGRRAAQAAEIHLDESDGRYERALAAVRRDRALPLSAEEKAHEGVVRVAHARLLAATGRVEDAVALSEVVVARAERDRQSWLLGHARRSHADLLFHAGRLTDAVATTDAHGVPLLLGRIALHTGDARQVRTSLRIAREVHERGDRADRRSAAWLLALAAFNDERPGDALGWLADDELPYAIAPADESQPPAIVRIALAAGRRDMVVSALERAESFAQRNPGSLFLDGIAAHTRGLAHGDLADLRRAVASLRTACRPLALAAALRDAATGLQHAGHREEAGRLGVEALRLYEGISAAADARAVRRQVRSYGITPPGVAQSRPKQGWASLTESELSVVCLVAEGRTNREVAQRLILSPHTVSTHLRHAFSKLHINSRVELARIAVDREVDRVPA